MSTLKASARSVDLVPDPDLHLSGFAARAHRATSTHDPLMAHALLLENNGVKICIVSCDLVGMSVSFAHDLRLRMAGLVSTSVDNIAVYCTHTHSGPTTSVFDWWEGADDEVHRSWFRNLQTRLLELVGGLNGVMVPATVTSSAASLPGIGYNRQSTGEESASAIDPGLVDDEVVVIGVDGIDGAPIATLVNYSVHPVVLGAWNLEYSGDFPGAVCREISDRRGGTCLFLQGACGDIEPIIYQDRGWGMGTYRDIQSIGEQIADRALEMLKSASPLDVADISARNTSVALDLDAPPSSAELDAYRKRMESVRDGAQIRPYYPVQLLTANVMLKWARKMEEAIASSTVPGTLEVGIQVLSIGHLRLIGLPLELYSEIGLSIKESFAEHSLKAVVVGYANGDLGYCPTNEALKHGGYGPAQAYRWHPESLTPISFGAADRIVAGATELV